MDGLETGDGERHTQLTTIPQKLYEALDKIRGMVLAFGVAVACTSLNILSYMAGETLHPTTVTLWVSLTIMSLSALALLITRPPPPGSLKDTILAIVAGFLTGSGSTSLVIGIILSEPAIAVSLFFVLPIIVIMLEAIIIGQKIKLLHLFLTVCSFAGVIFVTKPSFLFKRSSGYNFSGGMFGFLSAVFHGCSFMIIQRLEEVHTLIICLTTSSSIFVISAIIGIFLKSMVFPPTFELVIVLLAAGFSHFLAYSCAFLALEYERAFIVSIIMTFEVLFTFIAQWILLSLTPSWHSAIGGILISVSCIGVALTKDEQVPGDDEEELLLNE